MQWCTEPPNKQWYVYIEKEDGFLLFVSFIWKNNKSGPFTQSCVVFYSQQTS